LLGSAEPARPDQPGLIGEDDELCPISRIQLAHRSADMRLRGRHAHEQALPDLLVRVDKLSVEAIATDEERFLDRSRTSGHVIEEHVTSA
jgi:hypothetical protein